MLCFLSCLLKALVPLPCNDCLSFPKNSLDIYTQIFKRRICGKTSLNSSAVTIEEIVEKYNKTAKIQAGITGFTKRKQVFCK